MRFSHFFIDRPIFASVLSILIVIVGRHRPARPADRAVSRDRAADGQVTATYPGAIGRDRGGHRRRRRSSRRSTASRTCSTCRRSRPTTAAVASTSPSSSAPTSTRPRCWCRTASRSPSRACPRKCSGSASTVAKDSPDLMMVVHLISPDGSARPALPLQLRHAHVKDVLARVDGVGDVRSSARATTPCASGSTRTSVAARNLTAGDVVAALREQNVQVAAGAIGQPPAPRRERFQLCGQRSGPADARPRSSRTSSSRADARRRLDPPARRRARRAGRAELRRQRLPRRTGRGRARHLPAAGLERARRPPDADQRRDGAS